MRSSPPGDTALYVLLPQKPAEIVSRWRRLYDPASGNIEAHITIAFPPFVPLKRWSAVRPAVEAILGDYEPFQVIIRETGRFSGSQHILWLRPEDDESLVRVRAALEKALPRYVPKLPYDFVPHVTIGLLDSEDALVQAQTAVRAEIEPLRFLVDRLTYGTCGDDGTWHNTDSLLLGRAARKHGAERVGP